MAELCNGCEHLKCDRNKKGWLYNCDGKPIIHVSDYIKLYNFYVDRPEWCPKKEVEASA
jgi:hypothetical protein